MHIDRHHQQESADEGHDGDEQILRAVMSHLADLFQVLGQPPDQMAGLLVVEITEGKLLQVIEGQPPHVGFDIDAEHVSPIGDGRHQPGIQHINDQQTHRGGEDDPHWPPGRSTSTKAFTAIGKPSSSTPDRTAQEKSRMNRPR